MKNILLILFPLTCLTLNVPASELELGTIKQPIYFKEAGSASSIRVSDVPFVSRRSEPEWRFAAIGMPFIPPSDGSWKKPHDLNLASLYNIKVNAVRAANYWDVTVTIDATKAKVPEGYGFTIDQVVDSVTTCVKLMSPNTPEVSPKLTIKVLQAAE